MQRLCDDCHGVYKNKASFEAHQNRTGHCQNTQAILGDSGKIKTEIASLENSIMAKNAKIASLEDSLKNYENNIAILDEQKAQLSSLEHEKDIVRNTLKNLSKENYIAIGEQLGFVDKPNPQPTATAPVADVKPVEPEPELFIGKKTDPGWTYYDVFGFSVKK